MRTFRTFIAIELSDSVKIEISKLLIQLQIPGSSSVKWTAPEKTHLTLKFLGSISSLSVDSVTQFLRDEICLQTHFSLEIKGLGAFPNINHPRVIWLGVQNHPDLVTLQRGIEIGIRKFGFPVEDRPFNPHLTLGRVRENSHPADIRPLVKKMTEINTGSTLTQEVSFVHLYQSELEPGGAVYTKLFSVKLK